MKIGKIAIINKLVYATAIPSGVAGILPVPLPAVSFTVALRTGGSVILSAILKKQHTSTNCNSG